MGYETNYMEDIAIRRVKRIGIVSVFAVLTAVSFLLVMENNVLHEQAKKDVADVSPQTCVIYADVKVVSKNDMDTIHRICGKYAIHFYGIPSEIPEDWTSFSPQE